MSKVILIFFITVAITAQASKIPVDVYSQIIVDTNTVYVGDVLDLKFIPADVRASLEKIEIGAAPKAGETQKITNYAISEMIRYKLKQLGRENILSEISLKIPSTIVVTRKSNVITVDAVKKEISNLIKQKCHECEIEILNLSIQNSKPVPAGASWRIVETSSIPKGNQVITFEVLKEFNVIDRFYVRGNIRLFKELPVAKRNLSFGIKIQKTDYSYLKKDITFLNEIAASELDILGSEVATNINLGEVIGLKNLKRKFALQKGMPAQLIVRNPFWKIQLSGISQDDAYIGDSVRILNPLTKKIITGTIKDEGLVEVY